MTNKINFESAGNAREDEAKFLLAVDTIPRLTDRLYDYFTSLGCEGYCNPPRQIVTRQLDTPNYDLRAQGITLRIRGEIDGAGNMVTSPDICIKVAQKEEGEASGLRLRRGEYEAPIWDFEQIDFTSLQEKYPAHRNPEFQDILRTVMRSDVREHFRILTSRPRQIIQIPNAFVDLEPGKLATVELQADGVSFGIEDHHTTTKGGLIIFAEDTEVEYEINDKICPYDPNPMQRHFVSLGLTDFDKEKVFRFMNDHLENHVFPRGTLVRNTSSKAERGFNALDTLHTEILFNNCQNSTLSLASLRSGVTPVSRLVSCHPGDNGNDHRVVSFALVG